MPKTLSEFVEFDREEGLLVARIHFPNGVNLPEGNFFGIKVEMRRVKNKDATHYEVSAFGRRRKRDISHREHIYGPQKFSSESEGRKHLWSIAGAYKDSYLCSLLSD